MKVFLDAAKRPSNQRRKQMMRPYPRRNSLSPIIKRWLSRRLRSETASGGQCGPSGREAKPKVARQVTGLLEFLKRGLELRLLVLATIRDDRSSSVVPKSIRTNRRIQAKSNPFCLSATLLTGSLNTFLGSMERCLGDDHRELSGAPKIAC